MAVLNDKIITSTDIRKFNIDIEKSIFKCYNCEKEVRFRQSRNGDNNYTEHFYHPNTVKDTHIECEKNTLDRIRDNDTWHNKLSGFIEKDNKEVIRKNGDVKHIVDSYDPLNDMGIEFQNSQISVEAVQSRDATTYLDWIFNVEKQYIRKVEIGNRIICEIPHDNWEKAVKAVKNQVYLYTGFTEWILLDDRESYQIEVEGKRRNVWIGKIRYFQNVHDDTCLQNIITDEGLAYFQGTSEAEKKAESVRIIYARCKKSMMLLDGIHRRYVKRHVFEQNDILAIKSVAGSGKTTTLLDLAKLHSDKKILYLAFNKSLITEIEGKIKRDNIKNLIPMTFDSLLWATYKSVKKRNVEIVDLKPQNISDFIDFFRGKPFALRKNYVEYYKKFCGTPYYITPEEFAINELKGEKPLLNTLWRYSIMGRLITFDTLRKLSLNERWFKGYIDKTFDMIMVDETQDFDIMMLNMLLNDTTIPKLFVGDPMQSIYQWRGCINGFNKLPKTALTIEFYSTFRIGDPACELIRSKFKDCWMVSKSKSDTTLSQDLGVLKEKKYTYLFRTWRALFTSATFMPKVWIYKYEQTVEKMRKLHKILSFGGSIDDDEFEDDLPRFLRSIKTDELESIISNIEANLTMKEEASCKMYTIHSYKGLEDDNIRIADDILDPNGEDANLYYVALTRGMKLIVEDKRVSSATVATEQKTILEYFKVGASSLDCSGSSTGVQKPHGMFAGVRR